MTGHRRSTVKQIDNRSSCDMLYAPVLLSLPCNIQSCGTSGSLGPKADLAVCALILRNIAVSVLCNMVTGLDAGHSFRDRG